MDDSHDALTQQLVVVLRDRADAVRVLPDAASMRARLTDSAPASLPSPRVLAAAACTALVLGGAGVASAVGGEAPAPVEHDAPVEAARELPSTDVALATLAAVERAEEPAPTTAAPPSTSTTTVVPTTTVAAPSTTATPAAPPVTEPPAAEPEPVATTTTTAPRPPEARSTTTAAPVVAPSTTKAAPTTTSPPTTTKAIPFTMTQRWRRSSASPPFEEFSGTARPGATITVTSNHGGGTTVVDAAGNWALRVEFPTAPLDVSFTGKVKTTDQGQKSFTFKRQSPPA